LSIGVSSLTPDLHTTPLALIALADKALYESKLGGRNRVTLNTHEALENS
jgi:PleD family two-component response regulator